MRKTLSLRPAAERTPTPARTGWNVSETRRKRLKDMARVNRRNPTDAQKLLWTRLAAQRAGGYKFHRQVVIGSTIVSFACPSRWLVVEIAGKANAEVEAILDQRLSEVGVRVMRFTEEQVLEDTDTVIDTVVAELSQPFSRRDAVAANAAAAKAAPGSTPAPAAHAATDDTVFDDEDDFDDAFDLDSDEEDSEVDESVFDAAFAPAEDDAEDAEEDGSTLLADDEATDAAESADVTALFDSREDATEAAEAEQAAQ